MEILEIKKKIATLPADQLADYFAEAISESYDEGYEDGENLSPSEEENSGNIQFCLNELTEAKERGMTIDDLIRDLTIRSCVHMQVIAVPASLFTQSTKQHSLKL